MHPVPPARPGGTAQVGRIARTQESRRRARGAHDPPPGRGPPRPLRGRAGAGQQPAGQVLRQRGPPRRPWSRRRRRARQAPLPRLRRTPAGSTSTSACSASSASARPPPRRPPTPSGCGWPTPTAYADLRGPTTCALITDAEKQRDTRPARPRPAARRRRPATRAWPRISRSRTTVAALLMDQKVIAGVGNVYRAEVLFRHGIDPYRPGRDLTRAEWDAIWADLVALMREGVRNNRIDTVRPEHTPEAMGRPPRVDDHGGEVYVYRRAGRPCHICGTRDPHRRTSRPATSSGARPASRHRRLTAGPARHRPSEPVRQPGRHIATRTPPTPPPAPRAAAPAPARPAPARPARSRPDTPTPTPVRTGPDPPGPSVRSHDARPSRRREPPTPRVPRAERVRRPRTPRPPAPGTSAPPAPRPTLHQPHVQRVAQPDVAPPHVRDQVQHRIVDRPVARLDRRRQVDLEQEPPQRRVRRRVQRLADRARRSGPGARARPSPA